VLLKNFTQTEKDVFPSYQWTKVKKELLAGSFIGVQSPGFMVTNGDFNYIDDFHLLSSGPITIHKVDCSLDDDEWEEAIFFVFKEKWSRTELNNIVHGLHCDADLVRVLPNIDKMPSEEIARKFWMIIDDLSTREPLDCNLILSKINGLEMIGCFYDGNSLLWTNPSSPEQIDLVVKNLKQLCLKLKVELR